MEFRYVAQRPRDIGERLVCLLESRQEFIDPRPCFVQATKEIAFIYVAHHVGTHVPCDLTQSPRHRRRDPITPGSQGLLPPGVKENGKTRRFTWEHCSAFCQPDVHLPLA